MNDVMPASFGRGDDFFGLNLHQRSPALGAFPKSLDVRAGGRRPSKMATEGHFSSDNSGVFGYFPPAAAAPPPPSAGFHESYPEAPEMIPGPPLLNNGETNFLESFLENPAATYDNSNGGASQMGNLGFVDKNDFSWLMSERPPTIQGVAGEPTSQAFSGLSHAHPLMPAFTGADEPAFLTLGAEDDFFSAESFMNNANPFSTLMGSDAHHQHIHQHGHHHHRDSHTDIPSPSDPFAAAENGQIDIVPSSVSSNFINMAPQESPDLDAGGPSGDHTPSAFQRVFGLIPLSPVQSTPEFLESLAGMNPRLTSRLGPNAAARAEAIRERNSRLYRFGSDSHFSTNGFIPPPGHETEETYTNRFLRTMNAIRPDTGSTDHSRPSSPANPTGRIPAWAGTFIESDSESNDPRPLKRRRPSDGTVPRPNLHLHTSVGARQSSVASVRSPASATTTHGYPLSATGNKRRRSDANSSSGGGQQRTPAKPPRENLTEAQKRNNHIMSEQKRRNLIKQGFDELHLLVPELRAGGFSKSSVLMETASFLEKLIAGNRELQGLAERARGG